jgi:REP element-mobilizing transposase RayT
MEIWDDNRFPLAYLVTFRTYGTWLHGDPRGSHDRYNNVYRGPKIEDNIIREQQNVRKLRSEPFLLNAKARIIVEASIREVCRYRGWHLHALNVRTNHAHVVAAAGAVKPDVVLRDLKAYATRSLRDEKCWPHSHSPWSDGGSKRYLWREESLWHACNYVLNAQGEDLPDF